MNICGTEVKTPAFIFPGQGVQHAGMGKDFYDSFDVSRKVFEEASDLLGLNMEQLCFEEDERLNQTEYTQAALLTVETSILAAVRAEGIYLTEGIRPAEGIHLTEGIRLTEGFRPAEGIHPAEGFRPAEGIRPAVAAGLSLGEYSALVAVGAMTFSDAACLVRMRGRFMQEAVPEGAGRMAAIVGAAAEEIERACLEDRGIVEVANYNSSQQLVISGELAAVERVMAVLKDKAKMVTGLKVSVPSHCSLMKEAAARLSEELTNITLQRPDIPYVPNVAGKYVKEADDIKQLLIRQLYSPVRWYQGVEEMVRNGVDCFVEIGPGKALTKLNKRICKEIPSYSCGSVAELRKLV